MQIDPVSLRQAALGAERLSRVLFRSVVSTAMVLLSLAAVASARADARILWNKAQIDLPSSFFGNYSTNEDTGQEEFMFGVPSATFDVFGWIERAPRRFNSRPQKELARHLKSSLRSEGYRVVPKTEKWVRGRWMADFTGRSRGGSYRRQVSILPVRGGYFVITASALGKNWGSASSRRVRSVAEKIRAL